jgi:UDPglucose 6-dehydrogenase
MNISVVGTGYVGLVTGTCFAEVGNNVTCIDIDEEKVKHMQAGRLPIYEPGLEALFTRNIQEGRLQFTTELGNGVEDAEVIFLALPTPPGADGAADLSYVLGVADHLGELLERYVVVVDKSTVPIGTAEQVRARIAQKSSVDFDVVSNPEFLREGFAVDDFMKPNRVVVGTSSDRAKKVMEALYESFTREGGPLLFMDERSAEMTKYAANSFLATKLSFINEIANLCEHLGADVDAVRLGIGSDERIGNRFIFPGIGYGGSCFPKDISALQRTAANVGSTLRILEAVADVNVHQKQRLSAKVKRYFKNDVQGKTFALWGLAFKPDTDDIREAPSLNIIRSLTDAGASIVAYDPEAMAAVKRHFAGNPKLHFAEDAYEALQDADALLIATEWSAFKTPDFAKMRQYLKTPIIFDGRNIYDLATIQKEGFYYESIGRRVVDNP